jgi:hypothetical protein
VTVDIGTGVKVYDVVATRAGRRVEVTTGRTVVEVTEVTRSGTPVRTARFFNGLAPGASPRLADPDRAGGRDT